MIITIHKIEKYPNKWKVTFTSERNANGATIYTPVFESNEHLIKHLEEYINKAFPIEVINEPIEVDSSEVVLPKQDEQEQPSEPELSDEEKQLQELNKQLEELENEKSRLSTEIKNLLEDWKLDTDLVTLKNDFSIEDENYLQILEDKKQRKVTKYVELKTQYESLKEQIKDKQAEIEQFTKDNNLEVM